MKQFILTELIYLRRYLYRGLALNAWFLNVIISYYFYKVFGANFIDTLVLNMVVFGPIVYILFLRGRERKELNRK